jgi:hypothetical protein
LSSTVTVNPTPTVYVSGTTYVCQGNSTVLSAVATNASSYSWSNGATTPTITVSPNSSTTYGVTVTGAGSCQASSSAFVTVNNCTTPIAWQFNCTQNKRVEVVGRGTNNAATTTLNFTNTGNIDSIVVYAVAKNSPLPSTVTFASASQSFTVGGTPPSFSTNGSGNGNVRFFRAKFNATGSITMTTPQPSTTWSFTAYVFRNDPSGIASTGYYENAYIYRGSRTVTLPIPAAPGPRNITLTVPITEMSNDGRIMTVTATAGGVTNSYTINNWNLGRSLNITPLTLTNVPGNATSVTITVTSPNNNGDSGTIGGSVFVDAECGCPSTTVNITGPNTLCVGSSTNLSAPAGLRSYLWSTGATTSSITVSPNTTSTYSVTTEDGFGCVASGTKVLTVNPLPNVNISGNTTICQGTSTSLTATGGSTYLWSNGATSATITVSPSVSTQYCVTATTAGCSASTCATVTVNSIGTASITGPSALCQGSSANLSANMNVGGTYSYNWSNGATAATITVYPSATTNYCVTITDANGCTTSACRTISINPRPSVVINGNTFVCPGQNLVLSAAASGGTGFSYSWSNGATTSSITVSPTGPTTFEVTVTNSLGCSGVDNHGVGVEFVPNFTLNGDSVICQGGQATLSTNINGGGSGFTHQWSTGSTASSITVSPASTTTYTVTVSNSSGCSTIRSRTVTVNPNINVSIVGTGQLCAGASVTLTANPVGGSGFTYLWSNAATTSSITVTPASTNTFQVTVTNSGGCVGTATRTVIINPNPVLTLANIPGPICNGQSLTLTTSVTGGTPAFNYMWSNNTAGGNQSTTTAVATGSSQTYSVTVSDVNNCTSTSSRSITVNNCQVVANCSSTNPSVCGGSNGTATVAAAGGLAPYAYLWSSGATTSASTGLVAGIYTVTVTDAIGNTATCQVNLTNPPAPVVTVTGTNVICSGISTTLVASATVGSSFTYLWSTGATTSSIVVSPANSTNYTVTVTNNLNCSTVANRTVTVNASPAITINAPAGVCEGSAITLSTTSLNCSGCTFQWSCSTSNASTITFIPTASGTCSVTVTNSNGCTGTASISYAVYPAVSVNVTGSNNICLGTNTTLTATPSGGSGFVYAWSTGATTSSITVAPTSTINYAVTVTNANGCNTVGSRLVVVNPAVSAAVTGDNIVCAGGSATLTVSASGGSSFTYLWSNGATTNSTTVSPAATQAYSVTVTNNTGCTTTASRTVTVNTNPVVTVSGNNTLCAGFSTNLSASASGGSVFSYNWSNGSTASTITVSPAATTSYTVTVTNEFGCTTTGSRLVTVNSNPNVSVISSPLQACPNQVVNLSATASGGSGSYTYSWSSNTNGGTTSSTTAVFAGNSQTYRVTATDANGCTAFNTTVITRFANCNVVVNCSKIDPSTCGGTNGSASVATSGGVLPYSYAWSNGANTSSVSGLAAGSYDVTVTDAVGVTATCGVVLQNPPAPSAVIAGNDILCNGVSTTLTVAASGGSSFTYLWSTGATTASITVVPNTTTTYSVTVTNNVNCSAVVSRTVTVNAVPNVSLTGTNTLCVGQSTSLLATATGGTGFNYAWSNGSTTASISISPTSTTNYTVTVTNANGCTGTAASLVTVNPVPVVTVSGNNVICVGNSTTFTATAAGGSGFTYVWSNGATTPSITVSPTASTSYNVTVTNSFGCVGTGSTTLTVNPLPVANIGGTDVICLNTNTTLTAFASVGSSFTYVWSNGSNGVSITVSPASTTNYTVTVTNNNGCTTTASRTVTVNAVPNVLVTGTNVICEGNSTTISATANGGSGFAYLWSNGATTSSILVTPTSSTIYSVTVTNANGCTGTQSRAVTVNPTPDVTTSGTNVVCRGTTTTISANVVGGTGFTYNWSNGATTPSITVTPIATTQYQVTVTNNNGCTGTSSRTVTVNDFPVVTLSGTNVICLGNSTTLSTSVTGGTGFNYSWSNGAITSAITVSPTASTTYFVTVTNANGCTGTASYAVTVNPVPNVIISGQDVICNGNSTTLVTSVVGGSGFLYTWSTGANTPNITVSPSTTTSYTVTVTNANGCTGTATRQVTVNITPTLSISGNDVICLGQSTTLDANGSGGVSLVYNWSTGATGFSQTFAPLVTTTYTATVTNSNGCSATASRTVTVNPVPNPVISGQNSICVGNSTTLSTSVTGGSGFTFNWSTGATTSAITVSPIASTTYTVTVTNSNGCTGTDDYQVLVNQLPTPSINVSGGATSVCLGSSAVLSASGGSSYLWSNGATTATISVSPTATTTYSVTVTNVFGCSATTSQTITVDNNPVVTISGNDEICVGFSTVLTATGGNAFLWNTGETTQSITVNPGASSTFYVSVTNAAGCTATGSQFVTVFPTPTLTISGATGLCEGSSSTLVANGAASYVWSTGANTASITVVPVTITTYCVTGTDANGCTASQCVTVAPAPNPIIVAAVSDLCVGQSTTLTASGGIAYIWSTGQTTNVITVSPTVTTVYNVTATASNGCTATTSVTILVRQLPVITSIQSNNPTTCNTVDGNITVFAAGASGSLEYRLNGGAWQASNSFTGLGAGSYTVEVRYVGGFCTTVNSSPIVLSVPLAPTITINGVLAFCTGGSSTLTASGGLTYIWSTGATTPSITATAGGVYSVTSTASNGCSGTASVNIAQQPAPSVAIAGNTSICAGSVASLTATGGASYIWSNGSTSATITVSTNGTYQVTAIGGNGCTATASRTVTVNAAPNVQISGPSVLCLGTQSTLTASGASSYLWSNGANTLSITVTPSAITTYCVTGTDANGCTASRCITVSPAPNPSIVAASGELCQGESTTLTASGGASYAWSTSASTPVISVAPTTSTNYTVTVTSSNGCTATISTLVMVRPLPVIDSIHATDPTSCNVSNGSIVVFAQGTWAPLEYRLNGGTWQAGSVFANLAAGSYTIEVRYVGGFCPVVYTNTVTLNAVNAPSIVISAPASICNGSCTNISAILNPSVSQPGVTLLAYTWNTGSTTATINVCPTTTTTYLVTTTDANGCSSAAASTVIVNPTPTANIVPPAGACVGESAAFSAFNVGPGATYTWAFTPNATPATATGLSASVVFANPGNATAILTVSQNGCTSRDTVGVSVDQAVFANAGADVMICQGTSTILGGNGGSPTGPNGAVFQWVPSTGLNDPTVSNPVASPTDSTVYTVYVTYGACVSTAFVSVDVDVNSVPYADAGPNRLICSGTSVTIGGTPTGEPGSTYAWTPSLGLSNATSPNPTANPTVNTTYTVTVTRNGCQMTDNVFVEVINSPFVNAGVDKVYCGFGTGVMIGGTPAGSPTAVFSWSPTTGLSNPNIANPIATPSVTTNYVLSVTQNGCTSTDTVRVVVNPAAAGCNLPPVAINDINNTLINTPVMGNVSTNDFDPEGGLLTFTVLTNPTNGTLTSFNPNTGVYVFNPAPGFVGQSQFTYYTCDAGTPTLCDTATVTIVIRDRDGNNTPPVANDDVTSTLVGIPVDGDLLTNDFDPDGDVITVNTTPVSNPSNGTVTINPDGTFTYTPNPGFEGNDQFVYQICDPFNACDNATVTIIVTDGDPVNNPPFAGDDATSTFVNVPVNGNMSPNDYDVDGDVLVYNVNPVADPMNGTVTINQNGTYQYVPNPGYVGPDNFVYEVCESGTPQMYCTQATVYITVFTRNIPPVAINDINATFVDVPVSGSVMTNDYDPDNSVPLTVSMVGTPTSGTVFLQPNGDYVFIPAAGSVDDVQFTYVLCDAGLPVACDTAIVTISVSDLPGSSNLPPVANDDNNVTMVGVPTTGNILVNDADPEDQPLTLNTTPLSGPSLGTITINPNGSYVYTPTTTNPGVDEVTYSICDQGIPVLCDTATLYINIFEPTTGNHPPFAGDDFGSGFMNDDILGNILPNDGDVDGDLIIVNPVPVIMPANGSVSVDVNGNYTYTPNNNFIGTDQFVYQICDNAIPSLCAEATVYLLVYPLRQACFTTKVFLEGSYNVTADSLHMYNDLRACSQIPGLNVIPTTQPYAIQPYAYNGTESFANAAAMPSDMVDWVLVSFVNGACLDSLVYREAAVLLRDGSVVRANGDTTFCVPFQNGDQLRIVIEHRNHIGVMSANAITPQPGVLYNEDFRFNQSYIDAGSSGQKAVGTNGAYVMFAGDGYKYNFFTNTAQSKDRIDIRDLSPVLIDQGIFGQYMQGDYNMNCDCNADDMDILTPNSGADSAINDCP